MPTKNKLSIFLIKQEHTAFDSIIKVQNAKHLLDEDTCVYLGYSTNVKPQWAVNFLADKVNTDNIFVANARAVLLKRITIPQSDEKRIFALTMGYGKNMLHDDVVEERFGLKVVLNTIQTDSLRRINKTNIGGNQKLSHEQLPLKSSIDDFGLDINRDLVSHITGISADDDFATGTISGSDAVFLTADVDMDNVTEFLGKVYQKFLSNTYRTGFSWIDQIKEVKSKAHKSILNQHLINAVNEGAECVWMAAPEVINWHEIKGFQYGGRELHDEIDIGLVCQTFRGPLTTVDQLKSKRIIAISALDDSELFSWTALKCICGELSLNNETYCISNGKWYQIENDFVTQINENYAQTRISEIAFPERTAEHTSENIYAISVADMFPQQFLVLDKSLIRYGGGHSSIEVCDLLSNTHDLVHLKPYSGSSALSHLFNQGLVSAELMLADPNFLASANGMIMEEENGNEFAIQNARTAKVVFGIISKENSELPKLPFFSKISLKHVKDRLGLLGVDVSIKNIHDAR